MTIDQILKEATIEFNKLAYPSYTISDLESPYDTNKWNASMQRIAQLQSSGLTRYEAVGDVTKGWDRKELNNFLHWMKYYDSGDFVKYKFASLSGNSPGYFMSFKDNSGAADFSINPVKKPDDSESLKRKMISRINSLKKILLSESAREIAGLEYSSMMDLIYDLEKKVHALRKISLSNKTYIDLIYKQANKCKRINNSFGYELFTKFAQVTSNEAVSPTQDSKTDQQSSEPQNTTQNIQTKLPPPPSPASPVTMSGVPGNIPGEGPGQTDKGNKVVKPTENVEGLKGFVSKLHGNIEDSINDSDDLHIFDEDNEDGFTVEAQAIPQQPTQLQPQSSVDAAMDAALNNVTIKDVVDKLEQISQIFKQREIPRELSKVDMMLNRLNLSSYFSSLSEALNRALDSNNYIAIRIDEMLSQLKGSLDTPGIDLTKPEKPVSDQARMVKDNLENEQALEDKKKQMKKDIENQALESQIKEEPEITVNENDLNNPATTLPVAPPATPAIPSQQPIK